MEFLKFNFDRHLVERSPFVIELDLIWLSEQKEIRLDALTRFIESILDNPDYRHVYFLSIDQALEWLKRPRPIRELNDFWAFSCSNTIYEYDIDCSSNNTKKETVVLPNGQRVERLKSENQTEGEELNSADRQAEDLFRSDIVVHAFWAFIGLIVLVLFYDKYFASK